MYYGKPIFLSATFGIILFGLNILYNSNIYLVLATVSFAVEWVFIIASIIILKRNNWVIK